MPPRDLLEVAGLLMLHGRSLLAATSRFNDEAVGAYWAASRCRLDRWGFSLRAYAHTARGSLNDSTPRLAPLADEIVASDVLTRCVAAMFCAHDTLHNRRESAPVGRNILTGHREAIDRLHAVTGAWWPHHSLRHRALASLEDRCQRWTDLTLAYLPGASELTEFAFDARRMLDFAEDHAQARAEGRASTCANLLMLSLRAAFADLVVEGPNADLHAQIAGAALGCFGPEAFDSFGLLRSTWLDRMQRTTDETTILLSRISNQ
jgi:hypothetical protein